MLCVDPLPSIHLHNTLSEFVDHLPPDLLPSTTNLTKVVEIEEDVEAGTREKLGVNVEWVLGVSQPPSPDFRCVR